jgi:hypothetical protein
MIKDLINQINQTYSNFITSRPKSQISSASISGSRDNSRWLAIAHKQRTGSE